MLYILNNQSSSHRGVGRYIKLFKECFTCQDVQERQLDSLNSEDVVIDPFFDPISKLSDLARTSHVRKIAIVHDLVPLVHKTHFPIGLKATVRTWLNMRLLRKFNHIVTDSQKSKSDIVRLADIDPNKISVIYPYIDTELDTKTAAPNLWGNYFLYVGDANWNKNLPLLLNAFRESPHKLIVVGKVFAQDPQTLTHPWQKDLKDFLTNCASSPNIKLMGFVENGVLSALYKHAIANILVSHDEGFGFSVVEAGMFGTPSIVASNEIFREITGGLGAVFVPTNEPKSLVAELENLSSNPNARLDLGAQAKERSAFFRKENFVAGWRKVLENLE